ncbi:flagellar M-ring protein [Tepiditoga spiralis]|uniref:Flagellar M-ring protein n=1 Tax=Tepiditoga spiralis TaxID=2108365 RepID=A0A7G1G8J6_9BACT|nr:flagellar basal-body MS-ring/collar protein FliF [Tepiditoga spiralis]BBE31277.1 flagellar M-ring protein [Tepiditoga spiralis]
MQDFINNFLEWWKNLNKKNKVIYSLTISVSIIIIIILFFIISAPKYKFLISGVSETSSGSIIQKLEELNIPYKVTSGGSIYVAKTDPNALRMKLATNGSLGGSVKGYELLKDQGFGTTSYDKQVNYQIALEGELSRSISTLNGVQNARVHLVIPPKTYYNPGQEVKPKASVLVMLNPGTTLSKEQIRGIIQLVSGAVQGLTADNIKVVDNFSRDLSSSVISDGSVGFASTKFQLKKEIEDYYSEKIQKNLQAVFGFGNIVVISEVELNWQKLEEQQKQLVPTNKTNGIILSQQTEQEQSKNYDNSANGVPGTTSNIPPFSNQTTNGNTSSDYLKSKTITNYDVGEIIKKTTEDKNGEISKKSFTVFIDFKNANITENDTIKKQIQEAISTATGVETKLVSIVPLKFNRQIENMRSKIEEEQKNKQRLTVLIFIFMLVVIFATLTMFMFVKYSKKKKVYNLVEQRKRKLEDRVKEVVGEVEEEVEEYNPAVETQRKIENIVDTRIEDVVEIIKIWMNSQ